MFFLNALAIIDMFSRLFAGFFVLPVERPVKIDYNDKKFKKVIYLVRELIHDPILLARKSVPATKADLSIAQDLLDTLAEHRDSCVGMAANMIGELKNIIVFDNEGTLVVMLNPEIVNSSGPYETEEGCLSLLGGPRKTERYEKIKVRYDNLQMQSRLKTFHGFPAQIIQHEVDHCKGILI